MARKLGRTGGSKPFSASTDLPTKPKHTKKSRKDPSNAYTFVAGLPKHHRTSEQTLSLTREEALEAKAARRSKKPDDDEDNDMEARIRKVAMMIAGEDMGEVESDESDVDSDIAWEEGGSDDERWGDVFRDLEKGKKGKSKAKKEERVMKPAKPLTVNLDESEDEDKPVKAKGKTPSSVPAPARFDDDDEDEEEEDGFDEDDEEELEDEDDGDEELEGSDDDDDELDLDDAASEEEEEEESEDEDDGSEVELPSDLSDDEEEPDTLDGLDAFVDKLAEGDKKRKSVPEADQPTQKKRRVLPVTAGPALGDGNDLGLKSNSKVDLASLIASHPSLSGASSLLPSKSKSNSSSVLKQGVLSAPLPTVVQDRLNREAAYEKTKEEGAKWATLMKRVKEAEHLSFPLQGSDRGGVKSSGEMLAEFKPQTKHENAVQALLAKANLTESGVKASEDEALKGQDLSIEEIAERRGQLRLQRELMFREEAKAKRVAKIKSKTFRKLARKRAAKAGEADLEAMDEDELAERQEKLERERAKERATLKHSAKTGRWAKDAHAGGEERNEARAEMFDLKERLNRRIQGRGDDESEEDSEEEDDEEEDEGAIRRNAFDQLDQVDDEEQGEEGKGLMGMKFMKKAEERRRQERKEEEAELRRDIEMFGDEEDGGSGSEDEGKASKLNIGGTGGRMVFSGPRPTNGTDAAPAPAPTATPVADSASRNGTHQRRYSPAPEPESNPWLTASSSAGPSRKRNTVLTANSSSTDKAAASLKKAKSAMKGDKAEDDEVVAIETDGNKLLKIQQGESEDEEEDLMPRKKGVRFGQRDLVAEAFAGDNVVEEFSKEKQRVIEQDAPKTEDTSLPGWGSWSGKGAKARKPNPKFLKTTAGLLPSERKDAKYNNVIISEKKNKKASDYQVKDLPYPYTSVAQYEKRFENPLGSEWNSRGAHQKGTLPRVTKKKGAIIEPVRRLF